MLQLDNWTRSDLRTECTNRTGTTYLKETVGIVLKLELELGQGTHTKLKSVDKYSTVQCLFFGFWGWKFLGLLAVSGISPQVNDLLPVKKGNLLHLPAASTVAAGVENL